jgi:hypothetical protein
MMGTVERFPSQAFVEEGDVCKSRRGIDRFSNVQVQMLYYSEPCRVEVRSGQ